MTTKPPKTTALEWLGQTHTRRWTRARWWRKHYVTVFIITAATLILSAIALYYWRLPVLTGQILTHLTSKPIDDWKPDDIRNLTWSVITLIGAMAALATVPFQLIKTWMNERTAQTAEEGLITDRINKAVAQLGAEKAVHRLVKDAKGTETSITLSEPNIEVRLGGLYALERIAQDSLRDHIQIMEILCAYIRENTREPRIDEAETPKALNDVAEDLKAVSEDESASLEASPIHYYPPRADIQAALTILGRRAPDRLTHEAMHREDESYQLDLRAANLQRADLKKARLGLAVLSGTNLQEADLSDAILEVADLRGANLQAALLWGANLEGAYLGDANLQYTDLRNCSMVHTFLRSVELTDCQALEQDQINSSFGVSSGIGATRLPRHLVAPAHWHKAEDIPNDTLSALIAAQEAWLKTAPKP